MSTVGVWLVVVALAAALAFVVICAWSLYERWQRAAELAAVMARIEAATG